MTFTVPDVRVADVIRRHAAVRRPWRSGTASGS
jgi:hypothetical protein